MAHAKKMTRAAVGHLFKHYERGKDEYGEYVKFKNEAIDLSLSHLNFNLGPGRDISQGEFIRQSCSEIHCLNRKDINVACSWIVTLPKDFHNTNDNRDEREFFQGTYDFLEKRYGNENIVSSFVHMDETQPHMHFCFVPVKYDEKKQYYKLSAKEVITRRDLQTFHEDLREHLLNERDLYCNVLNDATREGNKSIEELKRGTAIKTLQNELETISEYIDIQNDVLSDLNANLGQIACNLTDTEHELNDELRKLEEIKKIRGSVVDQVKENKDFMGNVKSVTMPISTYKACLASHSREDHAEMRANKAEIENENLERQLISLKEQSKKLTNTVKQQKETIEKENKIFKYFPDLEKLFNQAWEKIQSLEKAKKDKAARELKEKEQELQKKEKTKYSREDR